MPMELQLDASSTAADATNPAADYSIGSLP